MNYIWFIWSTGRQCGTACATTNSSRLMYDISVLYTMDIYNICIYMCVDYTYNIHIQHKNNVWLTGRQGGTACATTKSSRLDPSPTSSICRSKAIFRVQRDTQPEAVDLRLHFLVQSCPSYPYTRPRMSQVHPRGDHNLWWCLWPVKCLHRPTSGRCLWTVKHLGGAYNLWDISTGPLLEQGNASKSTSPFETRKCAF